MTLAAAAAFVVAAWDLDEVSGTRADSVGSRDLTPAASIGSVGSTTGKFDNAVQLIKANDQYLYIADNADLSVGNIDFCLRVWVKLDSKTPNNHTILSKGNSGVGGEYYLAYDTSSDRFYFSIFGSSGFGDEGTVYANSFGSPSTGTWYLIHAWYDSVNNQVGICVNAGTADTVSQSVGVYDGGGDFAIGSGYPHPGQFWDGPIDDVVFLKNYILSSAERTEDFNGGAGVPFSRWTDDLSDAVSWAVAAWPLDETSGTRFDSIGSSDLTDNNTVLSQSGMFGNAADFEESNSEYFSCVDNTALSAGDVDLVVRCWVKLESKGSERPLVAKFGAGGSREYLLRYDSSTDRFNWFVDSGAGTGAIDADNLGSPSTSVWYLIHAWHDSIGNTIGISVNAGTPNITSYSLGIANTSEDFTIGIRFGSSPMDGLIDDVVILKNYILTAGQRTLDYNSGVGVPFSHWGPGDWTQEGNDTFTDTLNTPLASHTPDSGGTWSDVVAGCIIGANDLSGANVSLQYSLFSKTLTNRQATQLYVRDRHGTPQLLLLSNFSGGNMTGYAVDFTQFGISLDKFTGSGTTRSALASGSGITDGDTIRFESDGNGLLTVLVNGVYRCSVLDTTYTSGKSGVGCVVGAAGDNFFVYDSGEVAPEYPFWAINTVKRQQKRRRQLATW